MRPDLAINPGQASRSRSALLTVGSTSFTALIAAVLAPPTLEALCAAGFDELLLQYGQSALPPGWTETGKQSTNPTPKGLKVTPFAFRDGIEDLYSGVDLVISHAGAGSILTSLRAGKTLIAVVNGSFADNHQSELADALGGQGHLLVAEPKTLAETIASLAAGAEAALMPFPPADPTAFLRMIDEEAGYL